MEVEEITMSDYTTPIEAAFEMQRQSLKQSQDAVVQGVDLQKRVSKAFLGTLDTQEQLQRRLVELHRGVVHNTLDAVEAVPGSELASEDVRASVDESYDELLDGHAEAFETVASELENNVDAYDEMTDELLAAVEEQLDMLVEAHEELEAQSVEATEEVAGQVEELQGQVEEVQEQIQQVSEEAAAAVEA